VRRFRGKAKAAYRAPAAEIYSYKDRWFKDYNAALPKIREEIEKGYVLRTTLALTESQAKRLSQNLGEAKFIPVSEWNKEKVGFLLYKPTSIKPPKPASKPRSQSFSEKKLHIFLGKHVVDGNVLISEDRTRAFVPEDGKAATEEGKAIVELARIAKIHVFSGHFPFHKEKCKELIAKGMRYFAPQPALGNYFHLKDIYRAAQIFGDEPIKLYVLVDASKKSSSLSIAFLAIALVGKSGVLLMSSKTGIPPQTSKTIWSIKHLTS
jgi:hypothetical protein